MKLQRITIKNYEFININAGLNKLDGIPNIELGMLRGRLARIVGEMIEDMQSYTKSEEWIRLNRMIDAINIKHAERKPDGSPLVLEGRYSFKPDSVSIRDSEMEALREKESAAFEKRRELEAQYHETLRKESALDLPLIPMSLIVSIDEWYKNKQEPSPFVTEVLDYLNAIIDETA